MNLEAAKHQWTEKLLKRQYHSSLYERLALSRDKDEVLRLAKEGQQMERLLPGAYPAAVRLPNIRPANNLTKQGFPLL